MHVLNRVLNRKNMTSTRHIDSVNYRGERGRLSRTGGTGHQDESTGQISNHVRGQGQSQIFVTRNLGGYQAKGQRCLAPLGKNTATNSGTVEVGEGEIDVQLIIENR